MHPDFAFLHNFEQSEVHNVMTLRCTKPVEYNALYKIMSSMTCDNIYQVHGDKIYDAKETRIDTSSSMKMTPLKCKAI